jgi:transcriptional regulator with XRE-family HTH domain
MPDTMSPDEFRQIMRQLGLTQRELARILDTRDSTIRKWLADDSASTARGVNPVAAQVMRWMRDGFRPPEFPDHKRHHQA